MKFIHKKKWKNFDDIYSKNYSASPNLINKYFFFNKIDFDLAITCKEIGKKAEYIESKTKKDLSCFPGYLFLNLTDNYERNFFLIKQLKKIVKIYKIENIIYRFHPRFNSSIIETELNNMSLNTINYNDKSNFKKKLNIENCNYILSAVSSSLTSLKNYSGTIIVNKEASNFLSDKNFKYFIEVLKKNLSINIETKLKYKDLTNDKKYIKTI